MPTPTRRRRRPPRRRDGHDDHVRLHRERGRSHPVMSATTLTAVADEGLRRAAGGQGTPPEVLRRRSGPRPCRRARLRVAEHLEPRRQLEPRAADCRRRRRPCLAAPAAPVTNPAALRRSAPAAGSRPVRRQTVSPGANTLGSVPNPPGLHDPFASRVDPRGGDRARRADARSTYRSFRARSSSAPPATAASPRRAGSSFSRRSRRRRASARRPPSPRRHVPRAWQRFAAQLVEPSAVAGRLLGRLHRPVRLPRPQ